MNITINFASLKNELETAYAFADEKQACARLFNKDPYLWKSDPENIKSISNRLGWLSLPEDFLAKVDELNEFSLQIKNEGYKYIVILGMGGSSLCSEVTRETFPSANGYPKLLELDNTDPNAILNIEKQIDLEKTLFIVASKSGTTTEPNCFFEYYYSELIKKSATNPGKNFIAITDDGTPLVKIAQEHNFRKVFVNPSTIGGRYSVLSYFGVLPMALIGVDIKAVLTSAQQMEMNCKTVTSSAINEGVSLGVALGVGQKHGRDKITFVMSQSIKAFGYWVEQLLAESTGKEGQGLIPIEGEHIDFPEVYGNDRVFIYMYLPADYNNATDERIESLEKAGHLVVKIEVPDKNALGAEFYRWEVATAIAGLIIGINPFDEPNVAESKKNTTNLLAEWEKNGSFEKPVPLVNVDSIEVFGNEKIIVLPNNNHEPVGDAIIHFAKLSQPNDYIALLPYFLKTDDRNKILQEWRTSFRDTFKVATTLGYGPRYLHSTGQLHKGGPATGLYIILVGDENDLPIPGEKYGFATLQRAQALGDYRSLDDKGRRVIRIDLGKDIDANLKKLWHSVKHTIGHLVK